MAHALTPDLGFSVYQRAEPRIYDVAISDAFTVAQRAALERALNEWRAAVPELRLNVAGSTCEREAENSRHKRICVAPVDPDTMIVDAGADPNVIGLTRIARYDGGAPVLVTINVDVLTDAQQTSCEAHELGHAMGLVHTHKPGTLMFPSMDRADAAPTARDVRDWHHIRR